MEKKKVLPVNDLLFKKVFSSPQYSHILIGFINDVLGLDVEEVTIENTYNIKSFYNENKETSLRYTQVDVLARLKSGGLVTIEMQLHKQALFKERALYYVSELYTANYGMHTLESKELGYMNSELKYSALRPIYSICIMAETEFKEDKEPIHEFSLYDIKHKRVYKGIQNQELVKMVFLELSKYTEDMDKNIKDWFTYFKQGQVEKNAPVYIKDACKIASYQNLEEEERKMIDAREKAEQDALAREYYVAMEAKRREEKANKQIEEAKRQIKEAKRQAEDTIKEAKRQVEDTIKEAKRQVEDTIKEAKRLKEENRKLQEANEKLVEANKRMRQE
jgi:F0F1-type ATP synthase, subunit b